MTALNFSLLSRVAIYTAQVPQYRPQGAIKSLFLISSSLHPLICHPFLHKIQRNGKPLIKSTCINKTTLKCLCCQLLFEPLRYESCLTNGTRNCRYFKKAFYPAPRPSASALIIILKYRPNLYKRADQSFLRSDVKFLYSKSDFC